MVLLESVSYITGSTKNDDKNREKVLLMIKKYLIHIKEDIDFLDYCMSNKRDDNGLITFFKTRP
jgi:hypothetical protein